MSFTLLKLPYAFDALEPHIDARTMEIHYSKHYDGYTNNLNKAIAGTALENQSIEEILKNLDLENKAVRNNAGGYYNHTLYWQILSPKASAQPAGALAQAIEKSFGSFETFKEEFAKAGATQFGSGWAWLCVKKGGELMVCATPNQDNPLMPNGCGGTPILGMDVWEHAYYLKYQNRRADYIEAFFKVVNWDKVAELYQQGK